MWETINIINSTDTASIKLKNILFIITLFTVFFISRLLIDINLIIHITEQNEYDTYKIKITLQKYF